MIINAFENGIFLLPEELQRKEWSEEEDQKFDDEFYTPEEIPRVMPDLESEESAEQRRRNREGQGLKILTPDQMLSSLPITLTQLKPGNNSEKLKIRKENYYILCIVQKT